MTEKCDECEGAGYIVVILKSRSVGISTMMMRDGNRFPCPKCAGNKPWWIKDKVGEER